MIYGVGGRPHTQIIIYLASQFQIKHLVTVIFAQVEGYEKFSTCLVNL